MSPFPASQEHGGLAEKKAKKKGRESFHKKDSRHLFQTRHLFRPLDELLDIQHLILDRRGVVALSGVKPRAAVEGVGAAVLCVDRVVAVLAVEFVATSAAGEGVVARAAVDDIVSGSAVKIVVEFTAMRVSLPPFPCRLPSPETWMSRCPIRRLFERWQIDAGLASSDCNWL